MSNWPKRYNPTVTNGFVDHFTLQMTEDDSGRWVSYTDHLREVELEKDELARKLVAENTDTDRPNSAPVQASVPDGSAPSIKCWSCKQTVSLDDRADEDGACPYCHVELDLEEYLRAMLAAAPAAPAEDAGLVEALRRIMDTRSALASSTT